MTHFNKLSVLFVKSGKNMIWAKTSVPEDLCLATERRKTRGEKVAWEAGVFSDIITTGWSWWHMHTHTHTLTHTHAHIHSHTHTHTHRGNTLIGWIPINGGRERRDERGVFEEVFCTPSPRSPPTLSLSLVPALLRGGICPIFPGLAHHCESSGRMERCRRRERERGWKGNSCCL